jgi:hypothetical protein
MNTTATTTATATAAAAKTPYVPDEQAKTLFKEFQAECWKRQVSNADSLDKAILTYSSGALGISLTFLKDFVPIRTANVPWALYVSWILFTLAIVITMASYLVSQHGLRKQLKAAERYYLEGEDSALNNANGLLTEVTAWVAGSAFLAGVVLTTMFVSFNLPIASDMADDKKTTQPSRVLLKEGAPIPELLKKGAPIPQPQKMPAQQPAGSSGTTTPAAPPPASDSGGKK